MKLSLNWLQDYIDLNLSVEELTEKLTLTGLEVEEVEQIGSSLEGVVVGEVLEVRQHPNADRLQLCKVDTGTETTQIVCGAKNVAAGQKVAVATVGAVLPVKLDDGSFLKLRKAKLRGEESNGMICSEIELGLGDDHSGIMVLDASLKPGTPFSEVTEVYEDTQIEIAITPNRPDATCHLGVARDLSAALNLPLKKPVISTPGNSGNSAEYSVRIESKNCHRYAAKLIKNVAIGESPSWLLNRLTAIGVRPVNNVVDITNYVMYELGQPLHAFDFGRITTKSIVVKEFDKEVEFETLDHQKRKCAPGTLFICDGGTPVAMAGIMGGTDSEVSEETTDILLESAYFDPGTIRRTSKLQQLQSDASYRFERGVDPNLQADAIQRAADLITEICGGEAESGITDIHPIKTKPRELVLRMSYLNRLLGTAFDVTQTKEILDGLELKVISESADTLTFEIPTFRPDLEREVDLIEEAGRLYDYNNIEAPGHGIFVSTEPLTDRELLTVKIRDTAQMLGLREIYTNSLISQKEALNFADEEKIIKTLNPLNQDMSRMRPVLAHGFLKAAAYNFNRGAANIRFFEIGNVFEQSSDYTWHEGIKEQTHILFGLSGLKQSEHWAHEEKEYSIFDVKALADAFLNKLGLYEQTMTETAGENELIYSANNIETGTVYEVSDALKERYDLDYFTCIAEFNIDALQAALKRQDAFTYKPVPKFPVIDFDLAVVVNKETAAGDLQNAIAFSAGKSLISIEVFDVYEGKSIGAGKKSIAFRLNFMHPDKTLNVKDIEPIIDRVLKTLQKQFDAKLRS